MQLIKNVKHHMESPMMTPLPTPLALSSAPSSPLVLYSVDTPYKNPTNWCWVLFGVALLLGICMFVVLFLANKSNKTSSQDQNNAEEEEKAPVSGIPRLQVLNSIREGVKAKTFEHVIYFSLQDDAELFRFLINDRLIGQGNFEALDIRFSPPYRRVIFVTEVKPALPLHVVVESYDKEGTLIGEGDLTMTKFTYHNKP
jgi:hypothetical protein